MAHEEQDKVLESLKYFRTHATDEQKKEALALLETECKADVDFKDYIQFEPTMHIFNWNKLSDEQKQERRDAYKMLKKTTSITDQLEKYHLTADELVSLYGKDNLNELTYEDVITELFKDCEGVEMTLTSKHNFKAIMCCPSDKQSKKLAAINMILNVAKYLNKNEDGTDWVTDWENVEEPKWTIRIEWDELGNEVVKVGHYLGTNGHCNNSIVYFRTKEIAEQAIQILGEDIIKTALTTDY